MRTDVATGGTFPDYELPDHENVSRKLSEIQGEDPLILTLARGNYCPKEHQQHLELAANYPKIAVSYTKIATISTDTHHSSQEFRASTGAEWPFLSDPDNLTLRDWAQQSLLSVLAGVPGPESRGAQEMIRPNCTCGVYATKPLNTCDSRMESCQFRQG